MAVTNLPVFLCSASKTINSLRLMGIVNNILSLFFVFNVNKGSNHRLSFKPLCFINHLKRVEDTTFLRYNSSTKEQG